MGGPAMKGDEAAGRVGEADAQRHFSSSLVKRPLANLFMENGRFRRNVHPQIIGQQLPTLLKLVQGGRPLARKGQQLHQQAVAGFAGWLQASAVDGHQEPLQS